MPFVATPEQVKAFQAFSHRPGFSQEVISVDFVTTEDFVRSVLPPGLEPASKPVGTVSISTWESRLCGEFECTMVSLQATVNGVEGKYILTLIVSGDMPVTWGREIWGEVKKTGTSQLYRSGTRRFGYGERKGVRLVELAADFTTDLPPNTEEGLGYEIKAYPSSTGIGLHGDPRLVTLRIVDNNATRATGKGKMVLRGTKSDPLHEIPILSIGDFTYVSGVTDYTVQSETPMEVGDRYLPYLIGRHYDDLRLFRIADDFDRGEQEEEEEAFPVQRLVSP
ncbi:acetoacetate decarboxylase-domain-containing protein [Aspergillus californicus]